AEFVNFNSSRCRFRLGNPLAPNGLLNAQDFTCQCRRGAIDSRAGVMSFRIQPHPSVIPPFFWCATVTPKHGRFGVRSLPADSSARRGVWGKATTGVVFASSGVNETFTGGAAMPVTVKNISLWRKDVENQVGTLA